MKLKDSKWMLQFIKFGLVGVSNTLISYGIDMFGYYVVFKNSTFSIIIDILETVGIKATSQSIKVVIITAIAFFISVLNSYFWNNRFVFISNEKKSFGQHLIVFLRMTVSYALTGLILSPILKILLCKTGMSYWLAGIITIAIMVPLNFIINKVWAFRNKEK